VKILVLSNLYPPDYIGGYELACADVVDELRKRGHDARVLTAMPRQPTETPGHVLRRFKLIDEWSEHGMGSTPFTFRKSEIESRLINSYNVHALISYLEEFQPDVVYACALTGLGGMGLIGCLQYLGVPWVWQLGDRVPHHLCGTRQEVIPGLASLYSRYVKGHYIVVSQQLQKEIEAGGIALMGQVHLLPNWIKGTPPPARTTYYNGGHLRIMTAGQVARWKGVDLLIEAAAKLREAGRDNFSVHIYGKLHQHDIPSLIHKFDVATHVELKGSIPRAQLLEMYRSYDLFAFPTLSREPFGLVPLEAAAEGCVPVMARRCGIAEWLVHGAHCLKAERTAESFAQRFLDVMDGRVGLEAIGRRAQAVAWRDFHLDRILPKIEHILNHAARRKPEVAGTAHEAYRLARMAEHLTAALLAESLAA